MFITEFINHWLYLLCLKDQRNIECQVKMKYFLNCCHQYSTKFWWLINFTIFSFFGYLVLNSVFFISIVSSNYLYNNNDNKIKLMTMHKALHPRDNVDRLYVSRKEGGRGHASIEDSIDASIQWLKDYIQKHKGGLIIATRNDTENTMNNRMTITRKQKWEGKQLCGQFKRLINNISHDKT